MEFIEAVFYKKINPGDLLNIDISVQTTGGGQTYLDLAGIDEEDLISFLEYGKVVDRKKPPEGDNRKKYELNVHALGTEEKKIIEFDPRNNRPNYKISDQKNNRHPAWKAEAGFPKAPQNARYAADVHNTDNLVIYIIKTSTKSYYASFINDSVLPSNWPKSIGLESILLGNRKGIIFFEEDDIISFINDSQCPFNVTTKMKGAIEYDNLPDDIDDSSIDVVEYLKNDISINLDYKHLKFNESSPPKAVRNNKAKLSEKERKPKKTDFERKNKNNVIIGNAGEEAVLAYEIERLKSLGKEDLAEQVEWVSKDSGDNLGYDIKSFDIIKNNVVDIYIEIKTTTGSISKPFYISNNEISVSEEKGKQYCLFRIFEFNGNDNNIHFYRVYGNINDKFNLTPISFSATPK